MGVRTTALTGLLLMMMAVFAPASAFADQAYQATGALTYSWHGDPALGCAQAGVCDVQGTVTITPMGSANLVAHGENGDLIFQTGAAPVQVTDDPSGTAICADTVQSVLGLSDIAVRWNHAGGVSAVLQDVPSSGRCTGPLAQDLAGLIVHGTHSSTGFNLAGAVPFAAGPFSGTLTSTLAFAPGGTLIPGLFGSSGFSYSYSTRSTSPRSRKSLLEQVTLNYRVLVSPGTLNLTVNGARGDICLTFDSCKLKGSLDMTFSALSGQSLTLIATRPVRKPVTSTRAIADFAAGKLTVAQPAKVSVPVTVAESLLRKSALVCGDSISLTGNAAPLIGFAPGTGSRLLPVFITSGTADAVRTHCAGPEGSDVFPSNAPMMQTTIATSQLPAPQSSLTLTLTLTATGAFGNGAYGGKRSGSIGLGLTLVKATGGTVQASAP